MRTFLIFDLDGTLIDSNATCVTILQQMLEERGSRRIIDPVSAAPYMSAGGVAMVSGLLAGDCGDPEQELADFRLRYASHFTHPDCAFDGVTDGLERLQGAGFVMAICSNKPQNLCLKVLHDTGMARHFAAISGGKPGCRPKPATDLLDETLAQLGASASECIYIGDSEIDHALAGAAQMPFRFMTYGYAKPGWRPEGVPCFDQFEALVESLIAAQFLINPAAVDRS